MKNNKGKKLKLVYIIWEDACSYNASWYTEGALKELLEEDEGFIVHQVGWILQETKTYVLLVAKATDSTENEGMVFGFPMRIPKSWIIKRVDLTEYIG